MKYPISQRLNKQRRRNICFNGSDNNINLSKGTETKTSLTLLKKPSQHQLTQFTPQITMKTFFFVDFNNPSYLKQNMCNCYLSFIPLNEPSFFSPYCVIGNIAIENA
ncbi:CLUMA_CG000522, isoform A [Clunio marinus]|uniref:CLUMA_CG000522, isoform A n=1 Tax=Clunio marinus TaxID=568069 RepID=A0A1J1HKB8_9DIPT|nr:CLUMA_CG000522, isoform A [Clunio marinus]